MAERDIQEILERLAKITTKLDMALKAQEDHETRLRTLEGKDGGRWNTVVQQIIVLIAAGVVGWFLSITFG